MFVNSNNYKLGQLDDGLAVDNIELPPWASSPQVTNFIQGIILHVCLSIFLSHLSVNISVPIYPSFYLSISLSIGLLKKNSERYGRGKIWHRRSMLRFYSVIYLDNTIRVGQYVCPNVWQSVRPSICNMYEFLPSIYEIILLSDYLKNV